jgi:hypothetical protein
MDGTAADYTPSQSPRPAARFLQIQQTFCRLLPSQEGVKTGELMSIWKKLFSRKTEPRQRIRICVECGMPVAEHKDWCSILRTLRERDARAAEPERA